jgi:hypothetical protein
MLYNLDDCFIIAKSSNELDDLVNAINNAESKNDESLERFYYLDDVLPYYSLDELKELSTDLHTEYKS